MGDESQILSDGDIVTPGMMLSPNADNAFTTGNGAYTENNNIFAAIVGLLHIDQEKNIINVLAPHKSKNIVPTLDSIVTCKILSVNPRMAQVSIVCVGSKSISGSGFRGIIRKENVRDFEVDKVLMNESFRPGDIVRAKVVSLGTARSYELSTAETSLGVVSAISDVAQVPMVAISWDQMKCPKTNVVEKRKVAKV